ncbi:unnamed protein product [Malus baccata var. baccata]
MAASSSSSVSYGGRYDVFINFRREDTRKIFIGHLYKALVQKSIYTFIDGDDPELPTTIQESRLSIVVFSKNYASSTRCLKQLVHILDRVDTEKHIVVPIFYQIDPSDLRKLAGSFAKAFAQHDHDSNANIDEVQSWRSALTKAANFSGWASRDYRDEAKFIEGVVQDIFNQLLQFSKVYVSFRGEDTRRGFVAHLFKALHQNVLSTFRDTSADNIGDEIGASIYKVVKQSRISIVIFSENYANSPWCLDELVAILECIYTNNQRVLPVFYGVDPSDVRKAKGPFGEALVHLERRYSDNKVTLWRDALTSAACISGFDRRYFKDDAELIEAIVQATWRACRDFERILDSELE